MKTKKERIIDLLLLLAGAVFTSVILVIFEGVDLSVSRFIAYVIGGCLAGYGLREVVYHLMNRT